MHTAVSSVKHGKGALLAGHKNTKENAQRKTKTHRRAREGHAGERQSGDRTGARRSTSFTGTDCVHPALTVSPAITKSCSPITPAAASALPTRMLGWVVQLLDVALYACTVGSLPQKLDAKPPTTKLSPPTVAEETSPRGAGIGLREVKTQPDGVNSKRVATGLE